MKSSNLSKIISLFILCSVMTPFLVSAQTIDTDSNDELDTSSLGSQQEIVNLDYSASVNESDIDVTINPEFPGAFQPVSIKLDSNTIDLNHYGIQWIVNGNIEKGGIGLRSFTAVSGQYGSTIKISALINTPGIVIKKEIMLSPQDITVLWEAIDSYVPPFYRGKKIPGRESLIEISALPNFRLNNNALTLDNAVYLWTRNGNRILNVGGYAKNSIIIEQNRLRNSEQILSEISDIGNNIKAQKTITIPTITPEIHWYTKDTFNYRRLASVDRGLRIASGDTNLIAEPYFFSLKDTISDLTFQWKINNETIYLDPNAPNNELLVKNPEETGQASFQAIVNNPKTFLQSASKAVALYFQK